MNIYIYMYTYMYYTSVLQFLESVNEVACEMPTVNEC